jgi:hypothetical protein
MVLVFSGVDRHDDHCLYRDGPPAINDLLARSGCGRMFRGPAIVKDADPKRNFHNLGEIQNGGSA